MFSISQTSRGFFCLEWSSTENGPQIVSLNHLKIKNDFSDIFGDNIINIDQSLDCNKVQKQIEEYIHWIRSNPDLVLDFHELRRIEALKCKPHKGHYIINEIENIIKNTSIITKTLID